MSQMLTLVFGHESTDPVKAWHEISSHLVQHNLVESSYSVLDADIAFGDVSEKIKAYSKPHFMVKGRRLMFDMGPIGAHRIDTIRISGDEDIDWSAWVKTLQHAGLFVQAFVVDTDYNYWQNAHDPLQYKARGKAYEHLPMVSNELPPPLDRMIIDTSKNPGREVLRSGCIECVGSPMWFNSVFWEITGVVKPKLKMTNVLQSNEGNLTKVELQEGMFTDDTHSDLQDQLRASLFSLIESKS